MSRVRWTCPNPEHPGILAPKKIPTDDVRGFCLPCSEERGRLVRRVKVAEETARARKKREREERDRVAREAKAAETAAVREQRQQEMERQRRARNLCAKMRGLKAWRRIGGVVVAGRVKGYNVTAIDVVASRIEQRKFLAELVWFGMADGELDGREAHALLLEAAAEHFPDVITPTARQRIVVMYGLSDRGALSMAHAIDMVLKEAEE